MMMRKTTSFLLSLITIFLISCHVEEKNFTMNDIHIIPIPQKVELNKGIFEFTAETKFVVANEEQKELFSELTHLLKSASDMTIETVLAENAPSKNSVTLKQNDALEPEAYTLKVTGSGVEIAANGRSGWLYGIQSLRQLLPVEIESAELKKEVSWVIPQISIEDAPRYKWRGLMLDVSRHFFEKSYIMEVIDNLSFHKMNVLHLHLVDDQGWRIQIKKYPKLTEVGGYRVDQEDKHWNARSDNDPKEKGTYGGYYTQEDIKEIVKYAADRGIDVIPEIEMPAHVMSAIASYPEFSCFGTDIAVPSGGVWPITDIYCAGKEETFEFLENVLVEVMELFPSKFIHIGGDEATKTNWAKCPDCRKRMKDEGLKDVEELQSYFIKRMDAFLIENNRRLVGWDEILEGGLAKEATVMSWRGTKGGVEAAEHGNDVVMTPGSHCYFDHYQGPQDEEPLAWGGFTPLSKVYTFDPVVEGMTAEQAAHVLGGQANLWSEYIPTTDQSEYMIYPRLAALSETVWSTKESRDWISFSKRVTEMFKRYEYQGINYAKSSLLVTADAQINMDTKEVEVLLKNEFPDSDIRYTMDGSEVDTEALKYDQPIKMNKTTTVKASLFKDDKPIGKPFEKTIKFHKAVGKTVTYTTEMNKRYQGAGDFNMVNTLRGSKNFHDGQWQAWLGNDMEALIDLNQEEEINEVIIGALENQGPGIYFPTAFKVYLSNDGKSYEEAGSLHRPYAASGNAELRDFKIEIGKKARYVKVVAENLKRSPKGGGVFIFIDEIIIN